jgi:hypothetical protein
MNERPRLPFTPGRAIFPIPLSVSSVVSVDNFPIPLTLPPRVNRTADGSAVFASLALTL